MKTIILLLFANIFIGQEFITTIYIENSIGEKDSVQIGYDPLATIGVDTVFGEIDITSNQFSGSLEARVGQINLNDFDCGENNLIDNPQFISYLSKIDITPSNCEGWVNFIPFTTLLVNNKNFPLKITWSHQAFQNDCLDGSFISDWHPGLWFDASCGGEVLPQVYMKEFGDTIVSARTGIYLVDNFLDTLSMFHITLAPQSLLNNVKEDELSQINLFPNPTSGIVNIESLGALKINVFDHSGRLIVRSEDEIGLTDKPNGIYIIQLTDKNGNRVIKKVVKYDQ